MRPDLLPCERIQASIRPWARLFRWGFVCLLASVPSCGKTGIGDPCQKDSDCPSGLCLGLAAGFPGGYCSSDCAAASCEAGEACTVLGDGDQVVCLRGCASAADCHEGSQCYQGACQPRCIQDTDCRDAGYTCKAGVCVERPGKKLGESCRSDSECSSRTCVGSTCVHGCNRETACGREETCVLDRGASQLRGYCLLQRKGAIHAPLMACGTDSDCQRGSCVMGVCLLMCQHPHDCTAAPEGKSCAEVPAPLSQLEVHKWPHMKSCLPRNQNFAVPLQNVFGVQTLLVPATARSVELVISAADPDSDVIVGMSMVKDDAGQLLFGLWNPADPNGYFQNPIRHMPDLGSAVFLLSASPWRAPVRTAGFQISVMGSDESGQPYMPALTAIYKLFDQPITRGKLPLRFHIADLSGLSPSCSYRRLTAQNASTVLLPMVERLKQIYSQPNVQVEFDPITYIDSDAPTSVNANSHADLGRILAGASKNSGGGVDLVLLRSISPNGVLGIAGGIPGAPGLKNNPRTGAVMSMGYLCVSGAKYGLVQLAQTAAHELGHTLGLSHNRESNDQMDPLGDGVKPSESAQQDVENLMYWQATEKPGESLTVEQGQVIRSVPQVQP